MTLKAVLSVTFFFRITRARTRAGLRGFLIESGGRRGTHVSTKIRRPAGRNIRSRPGRTRSLRSRNAALPRAYSVWRRRSPPRSP